MFFGNLQMITFISGGTSIRGDKTTANGRIQPADQFNPARQIHYTFFQVPRFRLWTAMQQNWLLLVT